MSNFNKLDYDSYGEGSDSSESDSSGKKLSQGEEKKKVVKQNVIRGVLVGLGGSVRSIVIPYLIVSQLLAPDGFVQTMIGDMMPSGEGGSGSEEMGQIFGTTGNLELLLFYIIWLGVVSVAIKWAKAYSPKRSGSMRREFLGLAGIAIRIPGLYIIILTGCSEIFLSMMGMVYMTIDLTPYIIVLMGFVVIRLIPKGYSFLESIVIFFTKDDDWEEESAEDMEMEMEPSYASEADDEDATRILDTPMDDIGYSEESAY